MPHEYIDTVCVFSRSSTRLSWLKGGDVLFMAKTEPRRLWNLNLESVRFRYRIPVRKPRFRAWLYSTFQSERCSFPVAGRPAIMSVARAWVRPTNIIVTLISRLNNRTTLIFWSESHLYSSRYNNFLVNGVRGSLRRLYDGFAVPRQLPTAYVQAHAPGRASSLFQTFSMKGYSEIKSINDIQQDTRGKLNIERQSRVLLISARLSSRKGILELLDAAARMPKHIRGQITSPMRNIR
jgi:hypothetical protein